jgi:hypothetical protein
MPNTVILKDAQNLTYEVEALASKSQVANRAALYLSNLKKYKGAEAEYLKNVFRKDPELLARLQEVNGSIVRDITEAKVKKGTVKIDTYLINLCRLPSACFKDVSITKAPTRVVLPTPIKPPVRRGPYPHKEAGATLVGVSVQADGKKSSLELFSDALRSARRRGFGITFSLEKVAKKMKSLHKEFPEISDSIANDRYEKYFGGLTRLMLAVSWVSDCNKRWLMSHKGEELENLAGAKFKKLLHLSPKEQSLLYNYREYAQTQVYNFGSICPVPPGPLADLLLEELENAKSYFAPLLPVSPMPCSEWFYINRDDDGNLHITYKDVEEIGVRLDVCRERERRAQASAEALPGVSIFAPLDTRSTPSLSSTPVAPRPL